jgi:hypothetical protein
MQFCSWDQEEKRKSAATARAEKIPTAKVSADQRPNFWGAVRGAAVGVERLAAPGACVVKK